MSQMPRSLIAENEIIILTEYFLNQRPFVIQTTLVLHFNESSPLKIIVSLWKMTYNIKDENK